MTCSTAPSGITCGAVPANKAHPTEVVVPRRPHAKAKARALELGSNGHRKARLELEEIADWVEARAVNGFAGAQAVVQEAGEHLDERAPKPRPTGGSDRNG